MNAFNSGLMAFLASGITGHAQVVSNPKGWTVAAPIYDFPQADSRRVTLPYNTPEEIQKELLDTNIVGLIGRRYGLSEAELSSVQLIEEKGAVRLHCIGTQDKAFTIIRDALYGYGRTRDDGHTAGFCLAVITNKTDYSALTDPYLRAFLKERPALPPNWLTNTLSSLHTNYAGNSVNQYTKVTNADGTITATNVITKLTSDEVGQERQYILVDGEIAWVYSVTFNPDGSVDHVMEIRRDAKEYDPKYIQTIKEVEDQVSRAGIRGLGGVHIRWSIEKKKLEYDGIHWRSPAELNPNSAFD